MARKKNISINSDLFGSYITKLDELNADVKRIVSDVLEEAAKQVEEDTLDALNDSNLPAHGKYSKGKTKEAVVHDAKAEWSGSYCSVNIGFDKTKPNAGIFLITGTPKMKPDAKLNKIYRGKTYEKNLNDSIAKKLDSEIQKILRG